jgi:hypothetical protein
MADALTPDQRYDRSEKGRARHRRYNAKRTARPDNSRRVYVGQYYVGMAPTPEQATQLNDETKERFG